MPTQAELDRITFPLLDALEIMHRESFLHRDVSPDNIIIRLDGTPVLLDFGSSRQAVADASGSLTGIVKDGYSPIEQYASQSRFQGPWSDIYALGATLYRAVTQRPPTPATRRLDSDDMPPAAAASQGDYRSGFLDGIDACLKVKRAERPQSVAELRPLLVDALPATGMAWKRWAVAAALVALVFAGSYAGWYASQQATTSGEQRLAHKKEEAQPRNTAPAEPSQQESAGEAGRQAAIIDQPNKVPTKPGERRPMSAEEELALAPKAVFRDCDACPEMIVVPAGQFLMGSPPTEAGRLEFEGPTHWVTFRAKFAVGRLAVTRDEFKAFVDATAYRFGESCYAQAASGWLEEPGRSFLSPPGLTQDGRHPTVCVSWDDAAAYVRWLSEQTQKPYRLLTEAEREYITRAGTATPYWWGATVTSVPANFDTRPRPRTSRAVGSGGSANSRSGPPVGGTQPADAGSPNPWGFVHVHGNIAEWVQDCWNPDYTRATADGSAMLTGDCANRVVRGGAWTSWPEDIRAAYRELAAREDRYYSVGFRIARDLGKQ